MEYLNITRGIFSEYSFKKSKSIYLSCLPTSLNIQPHALCIKSYESYSNILVNFKVSSN